jgi:DNA-binding response OmpR family regulator
VERPEDGCVQICSLLLSRDNTVSKFLLSLLNQLPSDVKVCTRLDEAKDKLLDRKFDGVFTDCDHPDAFDLIRSVRKSKHNKRSIIIALVEQDGGLQAAFQSGAHFAIHKPLTVERSKRTLRAAHGLMMREKRSRFRNDISTSGEISVNARSCYPVLVLDLHRNGALIESPVDLTVGQTLSLSFVVPESAAQAQVQATVRWTDVAGRAGVQFQIFSKDSQLALTDWARRLAVDFDDLESLATNPGRTNLFERVRTVDLRY